MLAELFTTRDYILQGRLTVDIINSDLMGLKKDSEKHYQRCNEVIEIMKRGLNLQSDSNLFKLNQYEN